MKKFSEFLETKIEELVQPQSPTPLANAGPSANSMQQPVQAPQQQPQLQPQAQPQQQGQEQPLDLDDFLRTQKGRFIYNRLLVTYNNLRGKIPDLDKYTTVMPKILMRAMSGRKFGSNALLAKKTAQNIGDKNDQNTYRRNTQKYLGTPS